MVLLVAVSADISQGACGRAGRRQRSVGHLQNCHWNRRPERRHQRRKELLRSKSEIEQNDSRYLDLPHRPLTSRPIWFIYPVKKSHNLGTQRCWIEIHVAYITSNVIHIFIEAQYYLGQTAVARHLAVNTRCLIYIQGGSKTHAEKCHKCMCNWWKFYRQFFSRR